MLDCKVEEKLPQQMHASPRLFVKSHCLESCMCRRDAWVTGTPEWTKDAACEWPVEEMRERMVAK